MHQIKTTAAETRYVLLQMVASCDCADAVTVYADTDRLTADAIERTARILWQSWSAGRLGFTEVDGVVRRRDLAEAALAVDLCDSRLLFGSVEDWCRQKAAVPLDLLRGPLFRLSLLTRTDHTVTIMLSGHASVIGRSRLSALAAMLLGGPRPDWLEAVAPDGNDTGGPQPMEQGRLSEPSRLLADHPSQPRWSHPAVGMSLPLPAGIVAGVGDLVRTLGVGRCAVLGAALGQTLRSYTGSGDIAFGLSATVVGWTEPTAPVMASITADQSFAMLCEEVDAAIGRAIDVVSSRADRQAGLPQVGRLQDRLIMPVRLSVTVTEDLGTCHPGFIPPANIREELVLHWEETGSSAVLTLRYATDLFDPGTIEALRDAFVTNLEQGVRAPDVRFRGLNSAAGSCLPMPVEPASRWSDLGGQPATIVDLLRIRAAQTPDAMAVVAPWGGLTLTHAELDVASDALARRLIDEGIPPGARVGVAMPRCVAWVVSVLAIFKARAVYLPLDIDLPEARIAAMLADAEASLVLAEAAGSVSAKVWSDRPDQPRILKADWASAKSDTVPPTGPIPADGAYMVYTSGSTGVPKGIVVGHHAYLQMLAAAFDCWVGRRPTGMLARSPLAFDISLLDVLFGPATGGYVMPGPQAVTTDPDALTALLQHHPVELIQTTPALLRSWVDLGVLSGALGLRTVLTVGEALDSRDRNDFLARYPDIALINYYGPAETTIGVTAERVVSVREGARPTIGRPLPGVKIRLLDHERRPVPVGAVGEIFVGGNQLARGYHRREALTTERFVSWPDGNGERLYATGDLARMTTNGNMEFLGRNDLQVKIRGIRIELGEIEAALKSEAGVADAVAMRVRRGGVDEVAAHIVPYEADRAPDTRALRTVLAGRLPAAAVPSSIQVIAAFPLGPTGKIDRRALLAMTKAGTVETHMPDTSGVSSSVTDEIAKILAEVLDVPSLGPDDDFFEHGGSSLLALKALARIRSCFTCDLSLSELYHRRSARDLASLIKAPDQSRADRSCILLSKSPPDQNRPSVFCIHGAGGFVFNFVMVARALPGFDVYGLQARGLEDNEAPHGDIDGLCQDYADAIRARCPSGPYLLLGHSLGGLIALRIMKLLRPSAVHPQDRLIMIDTANPAIYPSVPIESIDDVIRRGLEHAYPYTVPLWDFLSHVLPRRAKMWIGLRGLARAISTDPDVSASLELSPAFMERLFATYIALMRMLGTVRAAPAYDGRSLLLRARDALEQTDASNGWAELIPDLEVVDVPGNHMTVLLPHNIVVGMPAIVSFLRGQPVCPPPSVGMSAPS